MSQPKGSVGVAVAVAILIVIAVSSVGYYQFVYCTSTCSTSTSSAASAPVCTPPACVMIQIAFGAATLTTTAYTPDVAKLVIGVNNTFQFRNNDSQSGGVDHSATAKTCPSNCPFDTGVIGFNVTSPMYTIKQPGTYSYYCVVHPTTMIGTIVVVAGSGGGGGGAAAASSSSSSSASGRGSSSSAASSSSSGANAAPKTVAISMLSGAGGNSSSNAPISGFGPGNVTVVLGVNNTLTWTNDDKSAHTVTSTLVPTGAATFNSGIVSAGYNYTMTFTTPGIYKYACTLHPWMKGEVIVKAG